MSAPQESALASAIAYLGAVEVLADHHRARREALGEEYGAMPCRDCGFKHADRCYDHPELTHGALYAFETVEGWRITTAGDLARAEIQDESCDKGGWHKALVGAGTSWAMPAWWSPEKRFAWRDPYMVTADLETGAEVPA